jgi:hypothetical protein
MSGIKLVPLDHKARIRKVVKALSKELALGCTNLTFIIEAEDHWKVQSTRRDDADVAQTLEKAANCMRRI